jgi:DNA polymerase elongation subunit (family B)
MIDMILDHAKPEPVVALDIVCKWRDRLFSRDMNVEDLTITQSVQKRLDEYKTETIHVRIARELVRSGKEFYQGIKIPYVVTGKDQHGRIVAVHADDFDGMFDVTSYWQNRVYPPTLRVLLAAFPDVDWRSLARHDSTQRRMFDDRTILGS